jgi:sugar lactone lactonase YvrE
MTIARILVPFPLLCLVACGSAGTQGPIGPAGLPGPEGSAGQTGPAGTSGMNGTNGANGADIPLPGTSYFPESIAASTDGTLYVSSLATGAIWKFAPNAQAVTKFSNGGGGTFGTTGLLIDDAASLVYACTIDLTGTVGSVLRAYKFADGTESANYPLPGGVASKCNDMVFDKDGNLFVADSLGAVHKLLKGGTALTSWNTDAMLAPATGMYGADGISYNGTDSLYVNNISNGKLFRIPIMGDGTSGTLEEFTVTPPLMEPDGMRQLDANTLLVTEGLNPNGRLTRLALDTGAKTAAGTVLHNRLEGPTSVVKVGQIYWITEGQIDALIAGMGQRLPFYIRRLPTFM